MQSTPQKKVLQLYLYYILLNVKSACALAILLACLHISYGRRMQKSSLSFTAAVADAKGMVQRGASGLSLAVYN